MAVDEKFRAIVTVDDRTAGPIRRIQANLSAIGQNSGLLRLGRVTGRLTASMGGLVRATASVPAALGAIGAVAAGAGLIGMVRGTVDAAGALNDLSTQLGVSVENLQALQFAAGQAGVGPEALTASMQRLSRGMRDATVGKNKDLAALFARMRIPLKDANGRVRNIADVMPQLAEALKNTTNPAVRTAMALALFGKAGGPMIAMLAQGSDGLKEQMRRWVELDGSITEANKGSLDEVGDRLGEVGTALLGVRNAIVVRLAPALGPLFERMATWIASNKELIATKVEEWVMRIVKAIEGFDLKKTIEDVETFLTKVNNTAESMGGWERTIKLVGAALTASLLAPLVAVGIKLAAIFAMVPPAWLLALLRLAAAPAAIGGAVLGLDRLGEQRDKTGDRQREQLRNFQERSLLRGFPAAPADPGDAPPAPIVPPPAARPRPQGQGLLRRFEPLTDPDTGERLFPERQSLRGDERDGLANGRRSLWPAQDAAPQRGQVEMNVRFENAPAGMRANVESRGALMRNPTLDVGYARLGVA